MGNMTDVSANGPKVFARCQQEFINRHVCICARLSIRPSLSARLVVTAAVCCPSAQWLPAQTPSTLQSSHLRRRFESTRFTLWHVSTRKKKNPRKTETCSGFEVKTLNSRLMGHFLNILARKFMLMEDGTSHCEMRNVLMIIMLMQQL